MPPPSDAVAGTVAPVTLATPATLAASGGALAAGAPFPLHQSSHPTKSALPVRPLTPGVGGLAGVPVPYAALPGVPGACAPPHGPPSAPSRSHVPPQAPSQVPPGHLGPSFTAPPFPSLPTPSLGGAPTPAPPPPPPPFASLAPGMVPYAHVPPPVFSYGEPPAPPPLPKTRFRPGSSSSTESCFQSPLLRATLPLVVARAPYAPSSLRPAHPPIPLPPPYTPTSNKYHPTNLEPIFPTISRRPRASTTWWTRLLRV